MFTRKWPLFVGLFACLATCSPALAQDKRTFYGYHPQSTLSLGIGFSPNDMTATKDRAVEYEVQPAEEGALSTRFNIILVRNSTQLKEAIGIDTRIDARYLAVSGNARFSYDQSSLFSTDSITLVLTATAEFPRLTMKNTRLTKAAEELIKAGKMREFEEAYGSDVVLMERRGATVAVILTITDVSAEEKRTILGELNASGGWGPLSAKAEAKVRTELQRASLAGQINVQVVATGGEGFGALGGAVQGMLTDKKDALKNVEKALADYLKQFTAKNAVPIGFHTASMRRFGWRPEREDLLSDVQERALMDLVEQYRKGKAKLELIRTLLEEAKLESGSVPSARIKELEEAMPLYEAYLAELAATHAAVLKGGKPAKRLPDPLASLDLTLPVRPKPLPKNMLFVPEKLAGSPGRELRHGDELAIRCMSDAEEFSGYLNVAASRDVVIKEKGHTRFVVEIVGGKQGDVVRSNAVVTLRTSADCEGWSGSLTVDGQTGRILSLRKADAAPMVWVLAHTGTGALKSGDAVGIRTEADLKPGSGFIFAQQRDQPLRTGKPK